MLRIIIYVVICIAAAHASLLYNSEALFFLAVCACIFLPILLVNVWLAVRGLSLSIRAPFSVAEKGKQVKIRIHAGKNAIPSALIEVSVTCKNVAAGKQKRKRVVLKEKEGRYQGSVEFTCKYSGTMQIQVEKVRVYDCMGIFCMTSRRWNKRKRTGERITVLPEYKEIPIEICERTRNFAEESNFYDPRRKGDDATETFQIREYLPGDKLQSVHWKLSAKSDELCVKDNGKPICYPIVLLYEVPYKGQRENAHNVDESLYVLASVAYSLLLQECPYIVTWYDAKSEDMIRVKVHDAEGFFMMLMELLAAGRAKKKYDWKQCYEDKYKGEICDVMFVLPWNMAGLTQELESRNYLF